MALADGNGSARPSRRVPDIFARERDVEAEYPTRVTDRGQYLEDECRLQQCNQTAGHTSEPILGTSNVGVNPIWAAFDGANEFSNTFSKL